MRLKSYFSGTVEAAMDLARRELGEDALLVNARPATPETKSLGAFEVVFGVADGAREGSHAPRHAPGAAGDSQEKLAEDMAEVKRQLERMGQALRYPRLLPAPGPGESALYARLLEAELEPMLAQQVAQGIPLESLFEVDATLGRGISAGRGRAVVALVGPPGAGKTSMLVKLAARYGLSSPRPAQILSIDVCRVAAADQLRSLAAILGMGCDVVETPGALAQALEEYGHKDYIFIDTPGYAGSEMGEARDLAELFSGHPEIDTHLVLPASMKPLDLARAVDRFEMFAPHKLIFTRMDETETFGPLINESARRGWPVSFLSGGQNIPDDVEPADKARLAAMAAGRGSRSAGAAA